MQLGLIWPPPHPDALRIIARAGRVAHYDVLDGRFMVGIRYTFAGAYSTWKAIDMSRRQWRER